MSQWRQHFWLVQLKDHSEIENMLTILENITNREANFLLPLLFLPILAIVYSTETEVWPLQITHKIISDLSRY